MMDVDLQDLTPFAIHIWRMPLDTVRNEMEKLHLTRDCRNVARGGLRVILARYLGCPPQDIQIVREGLGRPEIAYPEAAGLSFSLSHSGDCGLVAVSRNTVGVDIERVNPDVDTLRVAGRFFTPPEAERLLNLPEKERTAAFFRLWVLKEAYLKAHGETVPEGLSRCEILLDPDGPRLYSSDFDSTADVSVLAEVPVSTGYVAAVAGLQERADISVFDF